MNVNIRKIVTNVEEIFAEGFAPVDPPIKRCTVAAVIQNPFAGRYEEDLAPLMEAGEYLGRRLTEIGVRAMGVQPQQVENYGKGAVVGLDGELEHAAALLHPKLGKPMREVIGGGKAIIPSAKKAGPAGTALDVPLHYKNAAFVRTHYDAVEVRIPDAPKADEIVVVIAVTDGGRPHPRVGGLQIGEVKGEDGQR